MLLLPLSLSLSLCVCCCWSGQPIAPDSLWALARRHADCTTTTTTGARTIRASKPAVNLSRACFQPLRRTRRWGWVWAVATAIDARMADYIRTHPYLWPSLSDTCFGRWFAWSLEHARVCWTRNGYMRCVT